MTTNFEVTGCTVVDGAKAGEIARVWIRGEVASKAEAVAIAATFPKSLRVRGYGLGIGGGVVLGVVTVEADFTTDKVQGDKNEAGLKRLRRFLGLVSFEVGTAPYLNTATPEQLRAFLGV